MEKRRNRSIAERAQCIKLNAGLEMKFWAEAVSMAFYLINWSPRAALYGKLADEVQTGNEVDYSRLKVFRCPLYAHIVGDESYIFLGYQKGVKPFKLWDPKANKVLIGRHVIFYKKSMLQNTHKDDMQASKNHYSDEYVV